MNEGWEEMRWHVWTSDNVTNVPWNGHIIDTSALSENEVANQVASWLKRHLR